MGCLAFRSGMPIALAKCILRAEADSQQEFCPRSDSQAVRAAGPASRAPIFEACSEAKAMPESTEFARLACGASSWQRTWLQMLAWSSTAAGLQRRLQQRPAALHEAATQLQRRTACMSGARQLAWLHWLWQTPLHFGKGLPLHLQPAQQVSKVAAFAKCVRVRAGPGEF